MLKALVVDDDVNVGLFISRLLEKKFNCKVETVTDGFEALTELKNFDPDVIFLDVTMPGMDGIQTMEALKSIPEYRNIPIIMITAISEKEIVVKAMKMGAIAYILKPLIFFPVYEKIKEIFKKLNVDKPVQEVKSFSNKDLIINKILIIDKDEKFIARTSSRLEKNYRLLKSDNGIDGLFIYNQERPGIVIVSEETDDIDIKMLTKRLKDIAGGEVTIYIIKSEDKLTDVEKQLWDMVIKNK